ncbi:MAG: hypothetical protein ACI86X_001616 [Moritella sp.]|jgi:hypothetical protein
MPVFSPASRFTEFVYRYTRLIHSVKLGLALLIATLLNWLWPLPHFLWTLVTIVIIMMHLPQVGRTMEKSLQRAVGTIFGAAYGVLLIACFTDDRIIMALMIIAVMVLCYLAAGRFSYAYLVAGFTMIIVIGDSNHDTYEAVWRTLNILLGCAIAMAISLLVLPIKAKLDWRHQLSHSLHLMTKILAKQLALDIVNEHECGTELSKINHCILAQRNLFFSLGWESLTLRQQMPLLAKLADKQNRMVTLLALLSQSRLDENGAVLYADLAPKVNHVAMGVIAQLHELNQYINGQVGDLSLFSVDLVADIRLLMAAHQLDAESIDSESYGYYWSIYQITNVIECMYTQIVAIAASYGKVDVVRSSIKPTLN